MEEIPCEVQYTAPGPYPPVKAGGKDRRYGQAMLSNVGGGVSEMGAIASYLYGRFTQRPEVADCLGHIAMVEMHHLSIFSELSRQLGEDPRLWSPFQGGRRYWSPEYLRYPKRLDQELCYLLEDEEAAIRKYTRQAEWIRDANVVENLRRIIADEEVHVKILKDLLSVYGGQDLDLGLKMRATR